MQDFSTDIAKVTPVGALGQDTVTSHKLEIDALVFLTGRPVGSVIYITVPRLYEVE